MSETGAVPKPWRRSFAAQRARAYEKWRDDTGEYWTPEGRQLFYAGYESAWLSQRRIIDAMMEDRRKAAHERAAAAGLPRDKETP